MFLIKRLIAIFITSLLLLGNISPIIALENSTSILGKTQVTKEQLVQYYQDNSSVQYPQDYTKQKISLSKFVETLWMESEAENVRPEVAFAVVLADTNYLSFNNGISVEQYNYYAPENKDLKFNSVKQGLRGVIQHIKGYATKDALANTCVDPLYENIVLGVTDNTVEGLNNVWSTEIKAYGEIQNILEGILSISTKSSNVNPTLYHNIETVKWDEDNLQLYGWSYLEGINISTEGSVRKDIVIKSSDGKESLRVTAEDIKDSNVTKKYGKNKYNYDYSGFFANIPITKLPKDGNYTLYIETSSSGVKQQQVINSPMKDAMKEIETKGISNVSYDVEWQDRKLTVIRSTTVHNAKHEINKISWNGSRLHLEGWTILEGIEMATHSQVEKYIIVKNSSNKEVARYEATDKKRTDITQSKGADKINYNYSGYQVDIPMTKLTANGTYNLYISVKVNGYSKTVRINHPVSSYQGNLPNKVVSNKIYQPQWTSSGLIMKRTSPTMQQYTDKTQWSSNNLYIEGWALINNINSYSEGSISKAIVIKNSKGSEVGRYSATDIKRTDITSSKGGGRYNYNYSGYKASIPMSYLKASGDYRLYIEVKVGGATRQEQIKNPSTSAKTIGQKEINRATYIPSWQNGVLSITKERDITIMIDPGHEGKWPLDAGAARNGLLEYQLNNTLAKKIAAKLEAQGYNIEYTRNPNIEAKVPLWGRDEKVNEVMPDLLISLHHDSSTNTSARGFSIHWSSYRYKIDRKDIYLYMNSQKYPVVSQYQRLEGSKEHTYVTYIKGGRKYTIDISGLHLVVRDSTLSPPAAGSKKFAYILYNKLKTLDYLGQRYNPVSDHNLYITRETNVPTILVEAGFISNKTEARNVNNPTNQNKFTNKMVDAINEYFD